MLKLVNGSKVCLKKSREGLLHEDGRTGGFSVWRNGYLGHDMEGGLRDHCGYDGERREVERKLEQRVHGTAPRSCFGHQMRRPLQNARLAPRCWSRPPAAPLPTRRHFFGPPERASCARPQLVLPKLQTQLLKVCTENQLDGISLGFK